MEHVLVVAVELRDSVICAKVLQADGTRENVFFVVMEATVGIGLELDLHQLSYVLRDEGLSLLLGHLR